MMKGMASKVYLKVNLEAGEEESFLRIQPMTSNNCKEFAVPARSLRDRFTTLMKRYKSKTRREIKCTGLGGEEVSENEQLFEDVIE